MAEKEQPDDRPFYVFTVEAIQRSFETLKRIKSHEHFPGYLAILRALKRSGEEVARSADIVEFYDRYLRVEDAPPTNPYIQPFRSRYKGGSLLFNRNVAGSYAPSSLRQGSFSDVVEVEGDRRNATYRLRDDHASLASQRLLNGDKLPVGALATFLYRDYGLRLEAPEPQRVIGLFQHEFGLSYDVSEEGQAFAALFINDEAMFRPSDLDASR